MLGQKGAQDATVATVAGVAVEDDDRPVGRRLARRHEPRFEVQAVLRVVGHFFDLGQPERSRRRQISVGEVDETSLREPDDGHEDGDDGKDCEHRM